MRGLFEVSLLCLTACFDITSKDDEEEVEENEEEEGSNTDTNDTGNEDTAIEDTGTAVDTGVDDEGCSSDEIEDCAQECRPSGWLGDGNCDPSLDCEELNYDDDDCFYLHECGISDATSILIDIWGIQTSDTYEGSAWDIGGGLPDPYVCFFTNGTLMSCSETADDTVVPDLTVTGGPVTENDVALAIVILDEDISSDDEMGRLELNFEELQALVGCGEQPFHATYLSLTYEVRRE